MLPAAHRRLSPFDIKGRIPRTAIMRTTFVADVDHAVLGMLPAICCFLAAFQIKTRSARARCMQTTPHVRRSGGKKREKAPQGRRTEQGHCRFIPAHLPLVEQHTLARFPPCQYDNVVDIHVKGRTPNGLEATSYKIIDMTVYFRLYVWLFAYKDWYWNFAAAQKLRVKWKCLRVRLCEATVVDFILTS